MDRDWNYLRSTARPDYEIGGRVVRVVDLFAGCGGLTLGWAETAHQMGVALEVPLAVDFDPAAVAVYGQAFPKANVIETPVERLFDGELGEPPTQREAALSESIGRIHVLQGGPPCQGHSDLNNHTRRDDARNSFYVRMARAAEILDPPVVIIENVPTVQHDRSGVAETTIDHLKFLGYQVADQVVRFLDLGVPQRRKRHTVLAIKGIGLEPADVVDSLDIIESRDLRWAIGDLDNAAESPLDTPGALSMENRARIGWLFDHDAFELPNELRPACHWGDHSYVSMYGRLRWDEPAQTITSGYGSMGQGRYVHPSRQRTLTPHEAARIQFFPDWFDFTAGGLETRRGAWATMIGNAVPPKLTIELGRALLPNLLLKP